MMICFFLIMMSFVSFTLRVLSATKSWEPVQGHNKDKYVYKKWDA